MATPLTIADLRRERSESLEQFAAALGLRGKGGMSRMERGLMPVSLDVALKLEELSGGRIDAAALNGDVARARAGVNMAPADTAPETISASGNGARLTTPPVTAPEAGMALTTRAERRVA